MNKRERRCYFESDEYYFQQMRTILHEFPHTAPPMYPVQLLDHVYIGNQSNADNIPLLKRLGITHVLNCAGLRRYDFKKSPYPPESGIKGFLMISATDHESFNIARYFYEAIHFLDRVKKMQGRALIHCHLGVNRSGAIAAAYLMVDQQQTLLQVINYLKLKRFVVLTNTGFRQQLVQFARTKGLLDPINDVSDETEINGWPLKSNVASNPVTSSAKILRSLTLFDSTSLSVNRKDSSLKRYQRSWTVDKLINHCSENSMKKSRTFSRQSSLTDRHALPANDKTTMTYVEPVTRHSLPTVEITPSTETKRQETSDTDRRADKQTSLACHRPSALTPVDERRADETVPVSTTAPSKISGFFTLLSSKRSPMRSTSYSNVSSSSSQQVSSQSSNGTSSDEMKKDEPSAPLSTSRPLRVYTRSSTDSELYKTKSKYDKY